MAEGEEPRRTQYSAQLGSIPEDMLWTLENFADLSMSKTVKSKALLIWSDLTIAYAGNAIPARAMPLDQQAIKLKENMVAASEKVWDMYHAYLPPWCTATVLRSVRVCQDAKDVALVFKRTFQELKGKGSSPEDAVKAGVLAAEAKAVECLSIRSSTVKQEGGGPALINPLAPVSLKRNFDAQIAFAVGTLSEVYNEYVLCSRGDQRGEM